MCQFSTNTGFAEFTLLKENGECYYIIPGNPDRVVVCEGDCDDVNRNPDGVEACFAKVQQDERCGINWFEVGDNLCMCYPNEWLDCGLVADGSEDLYRIGNFISCVVCLI